MSRIDHIGREVWGDEFFAKKGPFDVRAYGALTTNTAAQNTVAIQAAIDAAELVKGVVYIPIGTWQVGQLVINGQRTKFGGAGKQATILQFVPTAHDQTCLTIANGAAIMYQNAVRSLTIMSADTTYRKTAISWSDCSELVIEDVAILPWTTTGDISTGLHAHGRDITTIANVEVSAEQPFRISANPNSTISADHYSLRDTYFIGLSSTRACVLIDADTHITNFTTSGSNAWVSGGGALEWIDGVSALTSQNICLQGIRFEQPLGATRYAFKIDHTSGVQFVQMINVSGGSGSNGFYFRKVYDLSAIGMNYSDLTRVAINALNCRNFSFTGCFFQSGSTITIPDMEEKWTLHKTAATMPIGGTSFWGAKDTVNGTQAVVGNKNFGVEKWAGSFTIAAGAIVVIGGSTNFNRKAQKISVCGYSAVGPINEYGEAFSTPTGLFLLAGSTNFAITNVALKLCLVQGGNTLLVNNTGQTLTVLVTSEWVT